MRKERSKKGGLHQVVAQLPSLMSPDCLCPPTAVPPDAYTRALAHNNNNGGGGGGGGSSSAINPSAPSAMSNRLAVHRPSMRLGELRSSCDFELSEGDVDMSMYGRQSLKTRILTLLGANMVLSKRVGMQQTQTFIIENVTSKISRFDQSLHVSCTFRPISW